MFVNRFYLFVEVRTMDNLEENATERILLEPYNYLLQLPGKTLILFLEDSMVLNDTVDLKGW